MTPGGVSAPLSKQSTWCAWCYWIALYNQQKSASLLAGVSDCECFYISYGALCLPRCPVRPSTCRHWLISLFTADQSGRETASHILPQTSERWGWKTLLKLFNCLTVLMEYTGTLTSTLWTQSEISSLCLSLSSWLTICQVMIWRTTVQSVPREFRGSLLVCSAQHFSISVTFSSFLYIL